MPATFLHIIISLFTLLLLPYYYYIWYYCRHYYYAIRLLLYMMIFFAFLFAFDTIRDATSWYADETYAFSPLLIFSPPFSFSLWYIYIDIICEKICAIYARHALFSYAAKDDMAPREDIMIIFRPLFRFLPAICHAACRRHERYRCFSHMMMILWYFRRAAWYWCAKICAKRGKICRQRCHAIIIILCRDIIHYLRHMIKSIRAAVSRYYYDIIIILFWYYYMTRRLW